LELSEHNSTNKKRDDLDQDHDLILALDLLKLGGLHGDILANTSPFATAKP
jgi:hypothetical protein